MNRKRVVLGALLGVLAVCLVYAYLATPRLEKAPPRTTDRTSQKSRVEAKANLKSNAENTQERINFAFLTVEPEEFAGAERDIFRFGKRPAPPPPTPVELEQTVEQSVIEMPEVAVAPVVPFEAVQKSLSEFTFLGFLEKGGEKTVFLSSGGDLFLVKRGETFGVDQEFRVDSIDGNLLKVLHPGRDGLVEIPLIEQQKLSASTSSPARIEPAPEAMNQPDQKIFTPKRRMLRPAAQDVENPFQKIIEENNPAERQDEESPAGGDALEEEVNGSN